MARRKSIASSERISEGRRWTVIRGDVLEACDGFDEKSFDAVLCDPPYGIRIMGRKWDYELPSIATWGSILRACKPGAPIVAFGSTRTYHRLACAIEDAGFVPRDMLAWMYGEGMPKGARDARLGPGWEGYATNLKPGFEPAFFGCRPYDGTIRENVARWGVGALAVDACRVGDGSDKTPAPRRRVKSKSWFTTSGEDLGGNDAVGRFPSNAAFDDEAAALLDEQSGTLRTHGGSVRQDHAAIGYGGGGHGSEREIAPSSGGASRFFYRAKVTPAERGSRNDHVTLKPIDLARYFARLVLPPKPGRILVPFCGSGSEMLGAMLAGWPEVVGIELDEHHAEVCRWRVENARVDRREVVVGG